MPKGERTVKKIIRALNKAKSRSSRTHIQKMMFFAKSWKLTRATDFEFILYQHGPYSYELDRVLLAMESLESITRDPAPDGYGSRYSVVRAWKSPPRARYLQLAEWLGPLGVRDLEARATCQYFMDEGSNSVEAEVRRVKPHLTTDEISAAKRDVDRVKKATKKKS